MSELEIQAATDRWITAFAEALTKGSTDALRTLLADPAYLRDNGALTWDYRQFHGREAVVSALLALSTEIQPHNFRCSESWLAPHVIGEGDDAYVEAFYDFDTRHGAAVLLLNGQIVDNSLVVRAIFTRIEALNGTRGVVPHPRGRGYTPRVPGETWLQNRTAQSQFEDSEPDVVIVGAGQAGLVTAAYLRRLGVNTLNIDRFERVGDSWGHRYDSLALHNPIEMNGFPFLPFPPHYPEYLSKDHMSEWLEIYARYMDLNVWCSTEFRGATYDSGNNRWTATVGLKDGTERTVHPRHIVMATGGIGGKPAIPALPGLDRFKGPVLHSSQFKESAHYGVKRAIIVGVATSAHDIARNLTEGGVKVTMLQRSPVVVTNVNTANLAYAGYIDPEQTTELVDIRYGIGLINPLREKASQAFHKMAKEIDRDLLDRLEAAGLELGDGVNGQGFLDLFLRTGGGYYLNTGTSEMIAEGKIAIERYDGITEFAENGAKRRDGSVIEADMVILATGYQSRKSEIGELFGDDVADRVGEIARLDEEGEWANIWSQTGQRGLWFNGGGINQMRPGSERLALLIKADLDGLIPDSFRRPARNTGRAASFAS